MKALFTREALASGTDITSENVLARALAAAESRAQTAADSLATETGHAPVLPAPAAADHPAPIATSEHPVPPGTSSHIPGEHPTAPGDHGGRPLSGLHPPGLADSLPHVVVDPGHPEFNLDNPLEVMSPELRALSEQHLTGSGETVLGPYAPEGGGPSYIDVAQQHGASYFDIADAWDTATPTERLAENQHVLDIAIANGDTITLSVPFGKIDPNSFTAAEIRYLEAHGYQRAGNNILAPPTGGPAQ